MALVVENGSGLENANAYLSVADTLTRLTELGFEVFSSLGSKQTAAVLRGTRRLDNVLASNLKGFPADPNQALVYPRHCFQIRSKWYTTDTVPEDILTLAALYAEKQSYQLAPETNPLASLPMGIKRVELPEGAEWEMHSGVKTISRDEEFLNGEIASLLNVVLSSTFTLSVNG